MNKPGDSGLNEEQSLPVEHICSFSSITTHWWGVGSKWSKVEAMVGRKTKVLAFAWHFVRYPGVLYAQGLCLFTSLTNTCVHVSLPMTHITS